MHDTGSLGDALAASATDGHGQITFRDVGADPVPMDAARLLDDAGAAARALVGAGVQPGARVGVLGPNRPDWLVWAYATWLAGGVLVPLPFPPMLAADAMARHAMALARAADCRLVLAEPSLAGVIGRRAVVPWDRPPAPPASLPRTVASSATAVVQFTSGSTSEPKGAELAHEAVLAALASQSEALDVGPGEYHESIWLPFFHDWGLFGGLVAPYVRGSRMEVLPTLTFLRHPLEWLRIATQVGANALPAPPSVWPVVLGVLRDDPGGVDLHTVRRCILAAEMVPPELVDRLREVGPRFGLDPQAVTTAYGMAEVVLGATMFPIGADLPVDEIDAAALRTEGLARPAGAGVEAKRVVSCGRPVPGLELRITGPAGPLPERATGEIELRGPALLHRYHGWRQAPFTEDGWFSTGDQGYLADGELHVTGRIKDLVIVHGQNFAPEDLEWVASRVRGVRAGRVVAFSSEAEGEATVAVEPARGVRPDALVDDVKHHTRRELGIVPRTVVVVERGAVQKTTSGKLRRSMLRETLERGEIMVHARG